MANTMTAKQVEEMIPLMVAIAIAWGKMYMALLDQGVNKEAAIEIMKAYVRPQPEAKQIDLQSLFSQSVSA